MKCSAHHYRKIHSTSISLAVVAVLMYANIAVAAPPIYSHKNANGTIIFSDAPLVNGKMLRTSYQAKYGRPVADASCLGLSDAAMAKRAELLDETIESAALTHKVDAKLLRAVAQIESCFDRTAVSKVGAQGVMQLMPTTAKELGVTDSFDATQNINGGARYLSQMLIRYNNNHRLALAAYNAGPGAVQKHNGVPPYPETLKYVERVLDLYSKSHDQKS